MNPLRQIFDAVVDLTPQEREQYLAEHPPGPELRAQLERMLRADATLRCAADDSDRALSWSRALETQNAILPSGSSIGPFVLEMPLGEGGSSTVYRAYRVLGNVRQSVALKILHRNLLSDVARRQFDRERRALAQLQHPNIARLIEGGITDGGVAWLAIELIDGSSITTHAQSRRLPLAARLQLFVAVCRTVAAAHQALIVHRDLKPSNILVSADGHVKLVDFGIAKWLADSGEAPTLSLHQAFTPAYSAPEQRAGLAITTATDVYALGIVLGELLTGERDERAAVASQSVGEAAAASYGMRIADLRRRLRGDLDNIIAKASAEIPAQRYVSAGALADDIERHLDGRPVLAHPPSRWYRARKFVGRYRGSLALTAVLAGATFASLGVALWQASLARSEARAARLELARANSLRDFLFETLAAAEPGAPRTQPMTLMEAAERAFAAARSDPSVDARARIELLTEFARVLEAQGDLRGSAERFEYALADARKELGAADPLTLETALMLARNERLRGEFDAARARADALLQALGASRTRLRADALRLSASLAARPERARERALLESANALEIYRELGDPEAIRGALNSRAILLVDLGESTAAIAPLEEMLRLTRARYGEQHEQVARTLAALARAQRRAGNLVASEHSIRAAVAMDRAIYPGEHWVTANHLNALSLTLELTGDIDGAIASARESYEIGARTQGPDHLETLIAQGVLAQLLGRRGEDSAALALWRETADRSHKALGAGHRQTHYARAMAGAMLATSDPVAGAAAMDAALAGLQADRGAEPATLAKVLERRAQIALEMHDAATAAATLEQLARVLAGIEQQRPYWPGRLDALRGELALLRGEAEAAGSMLASAVSAVDRSTYPGRLLAVQIALLQAQAARARGQADEDHLLRAAREAEGVQHLPARIAAQLGGAHTAR